MDEELDSNDDNISCISDDGSVDSQFPLDDLEGMYINVGTIIFFFSQMVLSTNCLYCF